MAQLEKGTRVRVLDVTEDWLRIRVGEHEGYIRNRPKYVRMDPAPSANAAAGKTGEDYQRQAGRIQQRIQVSRQRVKAFDRRETDVIEQLDAVDRTLNANRLEATRLQRQRTALAAQMEVTRQALEDLGRQMAKRERDAGRRLAALYKLSRLGGLKPLISAPTLAELFRRRYTLKSILNHDRLLLEELAADRLKLEQLEADQKAGTQKTQSLHRELRQRMALSESDRSRREELLGRIRSQRKLEVAAIENMKTAALALDEKIRTSVSTPPETGGQSSPFAAMAGLLKMPVNGKVFRFFGPYRNPRFDAMNFRSGIEIRADRGEPIQAVFTGRVIFASWFKGYGNMVIIDHGGSDYTVYAHMEEMFKVKGDQVETGEVIATVGETGSSEGTMLYFEIRHAGQPENPLDWVRSG